MSDFFANIYGHRQPNSIINGGGPLPPSEGLPVPFNGTADGRINYNDTLLGSVEPYSYGQSQFISSDASYINIPHKIPKIIPELYVPTCSGNPRALSHAVSDSDIAFVMHLARTSDMCPSLSKSMFDRQRTLLTVDPFINLCTLNYLIAGMQVCMQRDGPAASGLSCPWFKLLHDLDRSKWTDQDKLRTNPFNFDGLLHIVRDLIIPFGIVRGSEKQGGQDQGSSGASTWPTCFITTMNIDGVDDNVGNVWTKHELSGGSKVVLRLKPCRIPKTYVLNHWKTAVRESLVLNPENLENGTNHVWQLVPDVFDTNFHSIKDEMEKDNVKLPMGFRIPDMTVWCPMHKAWRRDELLNTRTWQDMGFWHIGLVWYKMGAMSPDSDFYYNDQHLAMRQAHLKMTFQPRWVQYPLYKPQEVQKLHAHGFAAVTNYNHTVLFARPAAAGVVPDATRVFHLAGEMEMGPICHEAAPALDLAMPDLQPVAGGVLGDLMDLGFGIPEAPPPIQDMGPPATHVHATREENSDATPVAATHEEESSAPAAVEGAQAKKRRTGKETPKN
jgi:hypothetical protein